MTYNVFGGTLNLAQSNPIQQHHVTPCQDEQRNLLKTCLNGADANAVQKGCSTAPVHKSFRLYISPVVDTIYTLCSKKVTPKF